MVKLKNIGMLIIIFILLTITYDLFQTAKQNMKLYSDLRYSISSLIDASQQSNGRSFIGKSFVDFVLEDITGRIWRLKEIRAQIKVIIIFSLNDCASCLQEYRLWKKIHEEYSDDKVFIIGIIHSSDINELVSFVRDRNLNFPILCDLGDTVRKSMGFRYSPLRIILNANDKILEIERPNAQISKQKRIIIKCLST